MQEIDLIKHFSKFIYLSEGLNFLSDENDTDILHVASYDDEALKKIDRSKENEVIKFDENIYYVFIGNKYIRFSHDFTK